jgi:hypothetical protein
MNASDTYISPGAEVNDPSLSTTLLHLFYLRREPQ